MLKKDDLVCTLLQLTLLVTLEAVGLIVAVHLSGRVHTGWIILGAMTYGWAVLGVAQQLADTMRAHRTAQRRIR